MTEKLYYNDSYTTEFTALIIGRIALGEHRGILLNRTFFYPTSGGQEHDTGLINSVRITDVVETDLGILHVASEDVPGERAVCSIDWERRFDNMQQHTGQHILSAACDEVAGAATVSAHMGGESSTIDVDAKTFDASVAAEIERRANSVVMRNLPVSIHNADDRTIGAFPLRKPPKVTGSIRVIEVSKFDYSACGGTHVHATGEVGLIKIRKWEKVKSGLTRIEFLCGSRALRDYQWKNRMINEIAEASSVKDSELRDYVGRLKNDVHDLQKREAALREHLSGVEAAGLLASAKPSGTVAVVRKMLPGRNAEELRLLAQKLTAAPSVVAFLASDSGTFVCAK